MSLITYNPNEVVYIIGIGYATLLNCGAKKTISQLPLPTKDRSPTHFHPELFNSQPQENPKQAQLQLDEKNTTNNHVSEIKLNSEDRPQQSKENNQNGQICSIPNIVKARLEGTNAYIFTSESNLSKSITISIKSLLPNRRQHISITIDISKTIDSLKKAIFEQIGEPIGSYYNIKLFATVPRMGELSSQTKTVHQCHINDGNTLLLTAGFAFGLKPLPQGLNCKFKITINNNTLASCAKPPPEPLLPIALPPIPPLPVEGEAKTDPPRQHKEVKDWQILPQVVLPLPEQKAVIENTSFLALCNISLESGRKYWQVKVEKAPTGEGDLIIGVCTPSINAQLRQSQSGCSHIWGFYAGSGRKGYESYDDSGNSVQEWQEEYGNALKANDLLGVLAITRGTHVSITFYVNAISYGQAFDIETSGRSLVPFISIGGESQATLDPRAVHPLDSYRLR